MTNSKDSYHMVLFVGGPMDGKSGEVSIYEDYVRHYVSEALTFGMERSRRIRYHGYRRRGQSRVFDFVESK